MKFFRQTKSNTCNLIAIQHVLSFLNQFPSSEEIRKGLPKHVFGSKIEELENFLNKRGIKTKLISNPTIRDIGSKPIIVNVDFFKIRKKKGSPRGHYVVIVKEKGQLYLYDGANYKRKVKTTFDEIYRASLDINRFHENGMWLVVK